MIVICFFFFFSSRRRHTRYWRDWSSDVCSSDLNALLKMLEEPPEHVVFVLATTEKHKVLPTIISRCQGFDFRRPGVEILRRKLAEIAEAERSEEHTSELQSRQYLVCRLLLEKKKTGLCLIIIRGRCRLNSSS